MKRTFYWLRTKLALLWVLSSAILFSLGITAQAHEVKPTIADLTVTEGRAVLELQINFEALLAGIDLDSVEDTDNAENAGDYDALRSLPAERIAARAPELLPNWNSLPLLSVDGEAVALESVSVDVPEGVDAELPRDSVWRLEAEVPGAVLDNHTEWRRPLVSAAKRLRMLGIVSLILITAASAGSAPSPPPSAMRGTVLSLRRRSPMTGRAMPSGSPAMPAVTCFWKARRPRRSAK